MLQFKKYFAAVFLSFIFTFNYVSAFSIKQLSFEIYPDSPLYFIDKILDFFEENITQNKIETAISLAQERINEYRYLKKYKPALAAEFRENELKTQLKKLDKLLAKLDDEHIFKKVQKVLRVPDLQTDLRFILEEDFEVLGSALAVDLGKIMSADEILSDYAGDMVYDDTVQNMYKVQLDNEDTFSNSTSSNDLLDELNNIESMLDSFADSSADGTATYNTSSLKEGNNGSAGSTTSENFKTNSATPEEGIEDIDKLEEELNSIFDDLNF